MISKKALLMILLLFGFLVFLSNETKGAINDDLKSCLSFDDFNDTTSNNYDASGIGGVLPTTSSCKIGGSCITLDGSDDAVNWGRVPLYKQTGVSAEEIGTVNCWVNFPDEAGSGSYQIWWSRYSASRSNPIDLARHTDTNVIALMGDGSGHADIFTDSMDTLAVGSWNMWTTTVNYTAVNIWTLNLYLNGVLNQTGNHTVNTDGNASFDFLLGARSGGALGYTEGSYDECAIWNRQLEVSELQTLYTNECTCAEIDAGTCGVGGGVPDPPEITVNTNLVSNTNSTDNPFLFTVNVTATNVTILTNWTVNLYLNDTLNKSVFTQLNLNATSLTVNLSDIGLQQVGWNINISINNTNGGVEVLNNIQRTNMFIDSVDPGIAITSSFNNLSILTSHMNSLSANVNCTDTNLFSCHYTFYELNNTDGSYLRRLNDTVILNINESSYAINFTGELVANNFTNGSYVFVTNATDSHTGKKAKNISWWTAEDTIIVEDMILEGDIKEELTEFYLSEEADRWKFKITWEEDQLVQHLNITAVGDLTFRQNDGYKGHFVYFPKLRFIDFESDNIEQVIVSEIETNKYALEIILKIASDEVEFESVGDLNFYEERYYFNVTNPFTVFVRDVFTNVSVQNFTLDVFNASDFLLLETKSVWNSTSGVMYFNISETVVLNVSSTTHADNGTSNISFYENGNVTLYVFASNSLYLFVYNEQTNQLITDPNVTIDIINFDNQSASVITGGGSAFYSGLTVGDYEIRYYATGFNTRSYYTTITSSTTQQLNLYLLNSSHATYTSFIIEDETGNTLEGTLLQVYRHFVETNTFNVVEMDRSNFNGVATVSLEHHEGKYRFIVLDTDGATTIYSSTSQEGYKITDNAYTLTATILGDTTESFFGTYDLFHNLSWVNSSKSFYFTVNDPSSLVDQFCVYVYQYSLTATQGETEICNNCLNASTGTAICNVTTYYDNGRELVAKGWIHTNTEFSEYWVAIISEFSDLEAVATMGVFGVFLGFLIMLFGFFAGLVLSGLAGAIIIFDIALIFVSVLRLVQLELPILIGLLGVSFIVLYLVGDK